MHIRHLMLWKEWLQIILPAFHCVGTGINNRKINKRQLKCFESLTVDLGAKHPVTLNL